MLAATTVDYSSKVKDLGRSTMGLLLLDFLDATIFKQGTATATSQLDATTPANQVVLGRIDPTESTPITVIVGSICFKNFPTPEIVPPVPIPQMKCVI